MRKIRYLNAVKEALDQEMSVDPDVVILGEDVRKSVRGTMTGLVEKYGPNRVIDTPISEQALIGHATGLSIMGFRPVVEFQIQEFVFFAFDQIIDQAQKLRYMSGGNLQIPVTYLVTASGAGGSSAGQHSDNPYPYVLHAGMKVVIPSNAYDAKGIIIGSIRDNDPVMVFLPAKILADKDEVPEENYSIPLGEGRIKKEGKDLTVFVTGHLVKIAVEVAEEFEEEEISIEVIDPLSLFPLDKKILINSVKKTGKLVIFDDSNKRCGFAAEVSSIITEECFESIKAPVKRVSRLDVPVPFSPPLENFVLPGKDKLIKAIKEIL